MPVSRIWSGKDEELVVIIVGESDLDLRINVIRSGYASVLLR